MASDPQNFDASTMEKRIFIKGFPKETTESELVSFFEKYGVVTGVKIVKDHKSGLAKYGFVTFDSKEVRESLCSEKSIEFQEKTLCIGKAKRREGYPEKNMGTPTHEFRRYFPTRHSSFDYSSSTAPLPAYTFYPYLYNQNAAVYLPATMTQLSSPSNYQGSAAYIPSSHQMFATIMPGSSQASIVQGMGSSTDQFSMALPRTTYIDGHTDYQTISSMITLPFPPSNDGTPLSPNSSSSDPGTKEFTETQLKSFFSEMGSVVNVRIVCDRKTGLSKGYGFVTFEDTEVCNDLINKGTIDCEGRTLKVSIAVRRKGLGEKLRKQKLSYMQAQYNNGVYDEAYIEWPNNECYTCQYPPAYQNVVSVPPMCYQSLPTSPNITKTKKSFTYTVKEDEGSEASDSSQISGAAAAMTTPKKTQCVPASPNVASTKTTFTYTAKEDEENETSDSSQISGAVMATSNEIVSE